jgi:hypothetical protein
MGLIRSADQINEANFPDSSINAAEKGKINLVKMGSKSTSTGSGGTHIYHNHM